MFAFNKDSIKEFDISTAKEFVNFWSDFYHETTKICQSNKKISYLDELNLGNKLTEQNVKEMGSRKRWCQAKK